MLKHILYWLLYWGWILIFISINGFFLYRMVSGFVRVKEKWRFRVILFLLLGGTSGMVIWVGDNNLLLTMPAFAALYLLCTEGEMLGRVATLTVFFCLIMSVCAIADTYLTFTDRFVMLANLIRMLVFGLLYAALKGRLPGEPASLSRRLWKLVLGLASMPFCVLVAVILLTYQRNDSPDIDSLSLRQGLVTLPIVFLTSVVLLLAILALADYEHLAQEKQLASLREIYYQGIQREQTQVRTLRHDLRNHLTVLQDLIESGKTEKAEDYVKQILGTPALRGSRQLCDNGTANAVLAAKVEEMARLRLEEDFQVSLPEALPIADMDLCALLGNALDNAMEAAVKARDKKISLRCRVSKGMLMLKVTNALAGDEREDLATTKADKKHHGFGLAGMRGKSPGVMAGPWKRRRTAVTLCCWSACPWAGSCKKRPEISDLFYLLSGAPCANAASTQKSSRLPSEAAAYIGFSRFKALSRGLDGSNVFQGLPSCSCPFT